MAKILERIRAWRRKRGAAASTDASTDWMTVGKTFRASDTVFDKNLPNTSRDEGRPRH